MQSELFGLLIVIFALCGLVLSLYIHLTKKKGKPLVCPMHGECDFVVRSEYSTIFGFPVEMLGVLYYAFIAALYSFEIWGPSPFYIPIIFAAVGLSAVGFLMSLYFTWLQLGVIKKWCTLCLGSALISTIIFILSLYGFWPTIVSALSSCIVFLQ